MLQLQHQSFLWIFRVWMLIGNWSFQIVMLEKILDSPLDFKEIKPVHPKGNQSWIFIGRTDAEAEAPILWPPDSKSWLIRKDPEAGKDWGQEEKGVTGDEIVGWMASSTQWMWVWANSRRQWRTGKPGVLQSMRSHRGMQHGHWKSNNDNVLPAASYFTCESTSSLYAVFPSLCWNLSKIVFIPEL